MRKESLNSNLTLRNYSHKLCESLENLHSHMPDKTVSRPQVERELARRAPARSSRGVDAGHLLLCLMLILGGLLMGLVISLVS